MRNLHAKKHLLNFRLYAITTGRILIITVLIVLLLAPMTTRFMDRDRTIVSVLISLVIWGIVFAFVFRWQLRRITRAEHPTAAAIEALMVVFVLFLAVFSKIYYLISTANPNSFTEHLDYFNSYYFSMTVFATVGFGDITPVTTLPRAIAMLQMFLDLILLGAAVRVIAGAASTAKQAAAATPESQDS